MLSIEFLSSPLDMLLDFRAATYIEWNAKLYVSRRVSN